MRGGAGRRPDADEKSTADREHGFIDPSNRRGGAPLIEMCDVMMAAAVGDAHARARAGAHAYADMDGWHCYRSCRPPFVGHGDTTGHTHALPPKKNQIWDDKQ